MRIDSSTVGMESARSYRSTSVSLRRFTVLNYRQDPAEGNAALNTGADGNAGAAGDAKTAEGTGNKTGQNKAEQNKTGQDKAEQTKAEQNTAALQDWQARMQTGSSVAVRSSASQTLASIRQTTVRYIFDLLFAARRNRLTQWMQENGIATVDSRPQQENSSTASAAQEKQLSLEPGTFSATMRVLAYSRETIRIEAEDTSFSTMGTVRTSDGREINFNVNVGMSRSFQEHFRTDLQLGFSMCDPLVINLDTDAAQLSDQTFYFDIDADGELDEISGLGSGSGYLALDKNGDGVINDGSELFGTANGDGFADLTKYDEDGNGWIDENDKIWDKLKIWCKDENGNDVLYRLADKGVGAICLQNVSTDFTLQGQTGQTQGAIRKTGVFLYENGSAGTVQHVDVAKYYAQA